MYIYIYIYIYIQYIHIYIYIYILYIYIYIYIYIFIYSNQLCYQAMSSTRTQSQLFTVTQISFFVQCLDFILVIAFVSRHASFH